MENEIQRVVVNYLRNRYRAIVHGTANGTAHGKRPPVGMLVGVPDVLVFEPRGGYAGLMIELKTEAGHLSAIQEDVCRSLADSGYWVEVCFGVMSAVECVDEYFSLPKKNEFSPHFEMRRKEKK